MRVFVLLPAAFLSQLVGCAPSLAPVDEIPLVSDGPQGGLRGLARDGVTGEFLVVAYGGLSSFTAEGAELPLGDPPELPPTDDGSSRNLGDVASLGDDRFVLLAQEDGHVWDRPTGRIEQRFCVALRLAPLSGRKMGPLPSTSTVISSSPRRASTNAKLCSLAHSIASGTLLGLGAWSRRSARIA